MSKVVFPAITFLAAACLLAWALMQTTTLERKPETDLKSSKPSTSTEPDSTSQRETVHAEPVPENDDSRLVGMCWIPSGRFEMGAMNTVPDEFHHTLWNWTDSGWM